jgi:hypothetical protein
VVVVVKVVIAVDAVDEMEAGPQDEEAVVGIVGSGEATEDEPPLDWNEALRLTLGDGRSDPASLELVVWLEELLDSTLHEDMSRDRGREVFIRTLLSKVETLLT